MIMFDLKGGNGINEVYMSAQVNFHTSNVMWIISISYMGSTYLTKHEMNILYNNKKSTKWK